MSWAGTPLATFAPGSSAYFVHSFQAQPVKNEHRLADAIYGGRRVTAAVRCDSVFGTQFHPEKSGESGISVVKSFLNVG